MAKRTTVHELSCTEAGELELSARDVSDWFKSLDEMMDIPAEAKLRTYGQFGAVYRIEVRIPEGA